MRLLLLPFLLLLVVDAQALKPGADIQNVEDYALLKTGPHGSKLFAINVPASTYSKDVPMLLDLTAPSSYLQGFDTGYLLGKESVENWNALMVSLVGDVWYEPAVASLVNRFADNQWDDFLSVQAPQEYKDELQGMTKGGFAAGLKDDIGKYAGRAFVLTNLPGSFEDLKYIIEDERQSNKNSTDGSALSITAEALEGLLQNINKRKKSKPQGFQCSMFGVWGSRTSDGQLYTGRNLDWVPQTGFSKNKLVTIYHPVNDKAVAHATIGWAGVWGAITGISAKGLTVMEANLESDDITFRGFPWVLRLRYVMTYAQSGTLDEAMSLWNSTNNTAGFNFGIGSAVDRTALVLETMMHSTAVFTDNDPREMEYIVDGENIGMPRQDAVYRTNHGYDPYTIEHYQWNGTGAFKYSITRYELFPALFDEFQTEERAIMASDAINITAIVADKGDAHLYDCDGPYDDADNVLSVMYDTENVYAYTAWERYVGPDSADTWTPAACNTYLKLDLGKWFDGTASDIIS